MNPANSYKFESPLDEGIIKSRPNRFIMMVQIADTIHKCHCPSTGRIGNIVFKDIPCLLSKSNNSERKTGFTVEAISLDKVEKKNKSWIGINQNKANNYVEFFIRTNQLSRMIKHGEKVVKEKKLGNSRIDFAVGDDYIEVKTPLIWLPSSKNVQEQTHSKFNSFDRLIKHFYDLSKNLKTGSRAILLMCYMYNAEPFKRPKIDKNNRRIVSAAKKAVSKGLENWQINLQIDKYGVKLLDYFELKMF
jgi:sugar fermentation stimulation protein A